MSNQRILPQAHLLNIIKETKDHHPNFALFLGAGASATSDVPLASKMINDWRKSHYNSYKNNGEKIEEHLENQDWYKKEDEYSLLFEKLYDEPSQRREYIESCFKDASPSWGYIYLVNLIRNKVFNTVFTTNFDDLINEACYLYSNEIRPIVCAHDSSINSIRITSNRPKVIKLHGDFLFDNIKNTLRELESLEQNTQDKFKQYASEFGFIFIGYSGNDRSVMDTLNTLLRFDHFFPNGIYWCVRKKEELSDKVENLRRFSKFRIVEIDGFDQFFAELHDEVELDLQPEMSDPYFSLAERLNGLVKRINLQGKNNTHPIIDRDIKNLGKKISRFTNSKNDTQVSIGDETLTIPLPYGFLADTHGLTGNYETALLYRLKEIETDPKPSSFENAFELLFKFESDKYKEPLLEKFFNSQAIISDYPEAATTIALLFISNEEYDLAERILDFGNEIATKSNSDNFNKVYYRLNKLQIKRFKKLDLEDKEIIFLKAVQDFEAELPSIGAMIILENYSDAEAKMLEISNRIEWEDYSDWPIFKLLIPHLKDDTIKEKLTS